MPRARTFRATRDVLSEVGVGSGVTEAARGEGMHSPSQPLLLDSVLQLIELARPLVEAVAKRDRDLASQVRQALSSVALNLGEGLGNTAGNSRQRFQSALGSLYEARAGLRVAAAWGYVSAAGCAEVLAGSDRLGARLYGLARR
jgi:four helix bundle protein